MQVGTIQSAPAALALPVARVSSTYFDPKDTNQDGVVSPSEELAYAQQHPEQSVQAESLAQYTARGSLSALGQTPGSSLNLSA